MSARARFLTVPAAALVVVGLAATAWAFVTAQGFGSGAASVSSLASASVSVPASSSAPVPVTWTAVESPSGDDTEIAYTVHRSADAGTTWDAAAGTCLGSLPSATLSCDDVPPGEGTFVYRVTAAFRSWTSEGVSGSVDVSLGLATQLAFTSAPQTLSAGVISVPVTIERQNAEGGAVTTGTTTVSLATTSATGAFRNLTDTAGLSSVTIADGQSSAGFLYVDTKSGSPVITASDADGVLAAANQTQTVNAGVATAVSVETAADGSGSVVPAQNLVAGGSITVFSIGRDVFGNYVANLAADTWSLTSITGGVVAADLAPAADAKSATFSARVAGTAKVRIVELGLVATDSGTLTVDAGPASKLAYTTAAQTLTAGNTAGVLSSTITVQSQDAYGNVATVTGEKTVTLGTGAAGGVFRDTADAATITSVTIPSGASSASFKYRSTTAGSQTLTAQASDLTSAAQAQFVNSAPVALTWNCPTGTVAKSTALTVTISAPNDAFGNAFTRNSALTVTLSFTVNDNLQYSVSTTSVGLTSGPANNTFTLNTASGNNKLATLTASVGSGFTAPGSCSMTT